MAVEEDETVSVARVSTGRFMVTINDVVFILNRLQADALKTKLSVALATDWAMGSAVADRKQSLIEEAA